MNKIILTLLALFLLCFSACGGDTEKETDATANSGEETLETADATEESAPSRPSTLLSYEEYNALSGEEQQEYFNRFSSVEAFFEWYNEAKAKYEEEQGRVEITGSDINIGDIVGKD